MKYDGSNLEAVIEEHIRWLNEEVNENGEILDEWRADFSGANLCSAVLPNLPLYGAVFSGANLRFADLTGTDLTRADFSRANMHGTRLEWANVHQAKNLPFVPMACPDTGSFIGWKQALYKYADGRLGGRVILKLYIPEDAERVSDSRRECRATKVKVLEIQTLRGDILIDSKSEDYAVSIKDPTTEYHVGDIITVPDISNEGFFRWNNIWHYENGLFFFVNRQEAAFYLSGGENQDGDPIDLFPEFMKELEDEAKQAGLEMHRDIEHDNAMSIWREKQ